MQRVLVANRGEIAVRVIRTLRDLGLTSIAVYSDPDRAALHVLLADEAYRVGEGLARESYLHIPRLIEVAKRARADAVHPGYGFLSENSEFAQAVLDAGLVFIGPPPRVIADLGNKLAAREIARKAGAPLVPGSPGPLADAVEAARMARTLGFPLMLKAAAGGGGKGMRVVRSEAEVASALELTRGEAKAAFGDDSVYLERFVERPRHVEAQILADAHGNVVFLGERDCSVQRRHQKVVEETPSPVFTPAIRERFAEAACSIARTAGYVNAGTVEFIADASGNFFFLEVNTRLQVEHPVTEVVTGLDLVAEQVKIADGQKLALPATALSPRGASMQCRLYAEDPSRNFLPSAGEIRRLRLPQGPGVRTDAGVYHGFRVPMEYDPLIAKVISWGEDRAQALARMRRALDETVVEGVASNVAFHRWLLAQPEFAAGEVHTGFLGERFSAASLAPSTEAEEVALLAASLHAHARALSVRPVEHGGSGWKFADRAGSALLRAGSGKARSARNGGDT
ncbi:MAG: acetyl-CoA carboxylase biotin carboxylase subunit [Candidatus Eiseniibacteriota bacterium]